PVAEFIRPEYQPPLNALDRMIGELTDQLKAFRKDHQGDFETWLSMRKNAVAELTRQPTPAGLALRFPLHETKGKAIREQVEDFKGKLSGKLESVSHGESKGLRFNGKTHISFENIPPVERDEPFTFTAWLKTSGKGNGSVFARMDEAKKHRGYDLWLQDGRLGTHLIHEYPDNALKVVTKEPLEADTWYHVAIGYDGSSKGSGIRITIDGVMVETKVENDQLSDSILTETDFRIGARSKGAHFKGDVHDLRIYRRLLTANELARIGLSPTDRMLARAELAAEDRKTLANHYFRSLNATSAGLYAKQEASQKERSDVQKKAKASSMIMEDKMKDPRVTYVLDRGQYDQPLKDQPVSPGVPQALPPLPEGAPTNRLGLAEWLMKKDHPLTARVAVNRYWTLFFGEGLVRTVGDFGNQGEWPSHPELLDWLATEFVRNDWDIKTMIETLVTSATYRQDSRITPASLAVDPENRLLGRGSRFRLQGEFIRDQALSVSGLLEEQIGGPSVKTYQPDGIWNEVSLNGGLRFKRDSGAKLYRRSLYTYWKRSAPPPNMMAFDAPTREKCTLQRARTNTPLQALVTLNDPQFVEAARVMAQRLIKEQGDFKTRTRLAFQLTLAREPRPEEWPILGRVYHEQLEAFQADPEKANALLKVGEFATDESLDPAEHAAWTTMSQMLLNLDETLTRS
ncbi:MAG: DUF1553 domain-containing protein, partial [Verrucomicrobiota bacterium]